VKIVFDAESSYKADNLAAIGRAGLKEYDAVIPRTVTEGIRVDGLDHHLSGRNLRPFERRPRRVGQGRRAEVPRLLGPARKESDADEAARARSDGGAHAGGTDRQEQRGALFSPRRRQGQQKRSPASPSPSISTRSSGR
jgi:hypothetical protein